MLSESGKDSLQLVPVNGLYGGIGLAGLRGPLGGDMRPPKELIFLAEPGKFCDKGDNASGLKAVFSSLKSSSSASSGGGVRGETMVGIPMAIVKGAKTGMFYVIRLISQTSKERMRFT